MLRQAASVWGESRVEALTMGRMAVLPSENSSVKLRIGHGPIQGRLMAKCCRRCGYALNGLGFL